RSCDLTVGAGKGQGDRFLAIHAFGFVAAHKRDVMIETIASNAFPCAHPVIQRVAPSIPLHFVLKTFKGGIKPWLAPAGPTLKPAFNLLNTEHFVVLGAAAGRRDTVFG